jgi:2-iminobutanoate/2-iminopropanoate deaminase
MSEIRRIEPPGLAPPGGHYSHAVVANGFVFVSGQLPITAQGQRLTDAPFEQQAEQVLANVQAALEAAGSSVAQLVQVRVYVSDIADWPAFNAVYARWWCPVAPYTSGFGSRWRRSAWCEKPEGLLIESPAFDQQSFAAALVPDQCPIIAA